MPNYNTNYTYSPGVAPSLIEYYERTLLENMRPAMVHYLDAQKRTLPEHNGKTVQFRKFNPFPAQTTPLSEGVVPDGRVLTETAFRAMVKPYGDYVQMTDEMQWYMLDNMHKETAQLLSDQAADSLEAIAANAYSAGLNVQYANGKTARSGLSASDKLTYADIKMAVRTLKRNNVRPFGDGYYHAIVHPDVVHDLTSDTMWTSIPANYDKSPLEQYALGTIYKVKFFESTHAKVFKGESVLYGAVSSIAAKTGTAYDETNKCITYDTTTYAAITSDIARQLTGKAVRITATISDSAKSVDACIERVDYQNGKIYFRWTPATVAAATWTASNSLAIEPSGAGAGSPAAPVYSTIVYGQNAFGTVELGGTGKNVRIIVKDTSSGGPEDPLEQKSSIAWKVNGFCAVILQDDFIVRIESGATA